MYAFGLPPFSLYDAYIKSPCQPSPLPPTRKITCYHHLTYNAFKYLSIKSCQLLIQLKENREQEKKYYVMFFIQCLQKTQRVSSYKLVFTLKFSYTLSGI